MLHNQINMWQFCIYATDTQDQAWVHNRIKHSRLPCGEMKTNKWTICKKMEGKTKKGKKYNLVNKCCSLKGGKTKLSILTGIKIIL